MFVQAKQNETFLRYYLFCNHLSQTRIISWLLSTLTACGFRCCCCNWCIKCKCSLMWLENAALSKMCMHAKDELKGLWCCEQPNWPAACFQSPFKANSILASSVSMLHSFDTLLQLDNSWPRDARNVLCLSRFLHLVMPTVGLEGVSLFWCRAVKSCRQ